MNWLDLVLLLVIAASIASCFRKGFSREAIGLAACVIGLILGSWFYGLAGGFLTPYVSSRAVANFIGFFIVFIGVMIVGAVVSGVVGKFLRVTGLSIFDHALGAGFGLLRGIVIAVAIIMGMMAFSPGDKPPDAVMHSRVAPYVAYAAKVCASVAPNELKEGFRRTYGDARAAWEKAWNKGIQSVPGTEKEKNERKI